LIAFIKLNGEVGIAESKDWNREPFYRLVTYSVSQCACVDDYFRPISYEHNRNTTSINI